jgi:phosphatidylethanolamine-binding protein (PEBP) family uncharacterized protein
MRLQSVDLRVPDVEATARFFADVFGLTRVSDTRLRGSDALPYIVGLERGAPAAGRFVPGKNTLGMHWLGPCSPKGNAPQHYVMTIIATSVEPGELPAGLTKPELLKALEGGKALRAASLVLRFAQ